MTKDELLPCLDDATPEQIERANAAVEANLINGVPRWESAQGYACALTAIMQADARPIATPSDDKLVEQEDAVQFLNCAFRNIDLPPLSDDDMRDIQEGLARFEATRISTLSSREAVLREENERLKLEKGEALNAIDRIFAIAAARIALSPDGGRDGPR